MTTPRPLTEEEVEEIRKRLAAIVADLDRIAECGGTAMDLWILVRVDLPLALNTIALLRGLLKEARDLIDTKYGPPGSNHLDRALLARLDAALGGVE